MKRYPLILGLFLIPGAAIAQMTPEEQQVSTALTGVQGGANSTAANAAYLDTVVTALYRKKDQEIQSLKTMVGSEDKRIKELQDQVTTKEEEIKQLQAKLKIVVQAPENQQAAPPAKTDSP